MKLRLLTLLLLNLTVSAFSQVQKSDFKIGFTGGSNPLLIGEYKNNMIFYALEGSYGGAIWSMDLSTEEVTRVVQLSSFEETKGSFFYPESGGGFISDNKGGRSVILGDDLFIILFKDIFFDSFLCKVSLIDGRIELLSKETDTVFKIGDSVYTFGFIEGNFKLNVYDNNGWSTLFDLDVFPVLLHKSNSSVIFRQGSKILLFNGVELIELKDLGIGSKFFSLKEDSFFWSATRDKVYKIEKTTGNVLIQLDEYDSSLSFFNRILSVSASKNNLIIVLLSQSRNSNSKDEIRVKEYNLLDNYNLRELRVDSEYDIYLKDPELSNIMVSNNHVLFTLLTNSRTHLNKDLYVGDFLQQSLEKTNLHQTSWNDWDLPDFSNYQLDKVGQVVLLSPSEGSLSDSMRLQFLMTYDLLQDSLFHTSLYCNAGLNFIKDNKVYLGLSENETSDFEPHVLTFKQDGSFENRKVIEINKSEISGLQVINSKKGEVIVNSNRKTNSLDFYTLNTEGSLAFLGRTSNWKNYFYRNERDPISNQSNSPIKYSTGERVYTGRSYIEGRGENSIFVSKPMALFSKEKSITCTEDRTKVSIVNSEGDTLEIALPKNGTCSDLNYFNGYLIVEYKRDNQPFQLVYDERRDSILDFSVVNDGRRAFVLDNSFFLLNSDGVLTTRESDLSPFLAPVPSAMGLNLSFYDYMYYSGDTFRITEYPIFRNDLNGECFVLFSSQLIPIGSNITSKVFGMFLEGFLLLQGKLYTIDSEGRIVFLHDLNDSQIRLLNIEKVGEKTYIFVRSQKRTDILEIIESSNGFETITFKSDLDFYSCYYTEGCWTCSLGEKTSLFRPSDFPLGRHVEIDAYVQKKTVFDISKDRLGLFNSWRNELIIIDKSNFEIEFTLEAKEVLNTNSGLYFSSNDNTGFEPYFLDSSITEPKLIKNLSPGSLDSNPSNFFELGGNVYCLATTPSNSTQLWNLSQIDTAEPLAILEELNDSLHVYPNPAINVLNLEKIDILNQKYVILDVLGRVHKVGKLKIPSVDISQLNQGSYFFVIFNEGKRLYKRFLKL